MDVSSYSIEELRRLVQKQTAQLEENQISAENYAKAQKDVGALKVAASKLVAQRNDCKFKMSIGS